MDSQLAIIQAGSGDLHMLQQVCRDTFLETYGTQVSEENLTKYITQAFSEEQLSSELEDKKNIFLLASLGAQCIAYVKLREEPLKLEPGQPVQVEEKHVQVERMYVRKTYQRKMIGAFLMNHITVLCRSHDTTTVWLWVWELNTRAIRFYNKWKFRPFTSKTFYVGEEKMRNTMMIRNLRE